ncbi:transposase [Anaerocolumna sp. AGMB13020]|uniref:transposase n=1 Tax=Anaerocolumna sp. AGMB13020 TaxID=3081750 RepID=UPI002FE6F024
MITTRWKCYYHFVFISRYRKKVLHGKGREDVREISVVFPQKISISDFMGYLKGKSH